MVDGEDDQITTKCHGGIAQRRSRSEGSAGRVGDGKIGRAFPNCRKDTM